MDGSELAKNKRAKLVLWAKHKWWARFVRPGEKKKEKLKKKRKGKFEARVINGLIIWPALFSGREKWSENSLTFPKIYYYAFGIEHKKTLGGRIRAANGNDDDVPVEECGGVRIYCMLDVPKKYWLMGGQARAKKASSSSGNDR